MVEIEAGLKEPPGVGSGLGERFLLNDAPLDATRVAPRAHCDGTCKRAAQGDQTASGSFLEDKRRCGLVNARCKPGRCRRSRRSLEARVVQPPVRGGAFEMLVLACVVDDATPA